MKNKIVPNIWFNTDNGELDELLKYYKTIFESNFNAGKTISLGETPSGNTGMCEVQLFNQEYLLMNTEKEHHALNDAVSLIIHCDDQQEIDKYWDYFTKEGKESQCGWCIDKYGLRWQVLPKNFGELLSLPDTGEVMMSQKKIVIKEYLNNKNESG